MSTHGQTIAIVGASLTWLKDQRVIAGMNVNVWNVNEDVQRLIRSRQEINPGALRDHSTPLGEPIDQPTPGDAR